MNTPKKAGQSLAGYLREHHAMIEQQQHIGIKQATILQHIHQAGFPNASLQTLRTLLYQARKTNQKISSNKTEIKLNEKPTNDTNTKPNETTNKKQNAKQNTKQNQQTHLSKNQSKNQNQPPSTKPKKDIIRHPHQEPITPNSSTETRSFHYSGSSNTPIEDLI